MLRVGVRRFSAQLGGTSVEKFIRSMDAIPFGYHYFHPVILQANKGDMKALISYRPVYDGTVPGTMHTGVLATVFDQISGFCGWSMLEGMFVYYQFCCTYNE